MSLNKVEGQKQAVVYVRVSTKEQVDEGNSLVTQERICREYASKNNYEVIEVFVEQGESAKTADRSELQRLLKFCAIKKNEINAVIIYKLDRLSRNTDDYSQIRLLLKRYRVEIKSTSEHFENTPVGRFMENTMANIAQFDNDIRAERSTNGMREAIREGRYVWSAPRGYLNIKVGGKSTIGQNNDLVPLVRQAFQLVASMVHSTEEVRMIMAKKGLVTKDGKPLAKGYFTRMLNNELYKGVIRKFGEVHKGLFTPIISEELFDKVQRVLKYRERKHCLHITDREDFPLRRFVKDENGRKLTGSWSKGRSKKYPYYRFSGNGSNFNRNSFEEQYMQFMDCYQFNPQKVKQLKHFLKINIKNSIKDFNQEHDEAVKQIAVLKEKQTTLIRKSLDGIIPDTILKEHLEVIDKEIFELNSRLVQNGPISLESTDIDKSTKLFLTKPSKIWRILPIHSKIKLQWFQFPEGVVFTNNSFGTTQRCLLFNLKDQFLSKKYLNVPPKNEIWNQLAKELRELKIILNESDNIGDDNNRSP